jgi:hypothetical protein
MIRAQAGNHFLFGITKENVTRLMAGEPIVVKLNEHGLQGPAISIVICYGETEEALALELREFIGPQTTVTDRRTPTPGQRRP